MKYELVKSFKMISSEERIIEFIDKNTETLKILEAIEPLLRKHFPNASFSIELCDYLTWTTEEKILINVPVSEESFFNSALRSFKEIYKSIGHLLEDIICPIVLIPYIPNKSYDRFKEDCAINLMARTAYFNNDFDKNMQREMTLRDIPKSQMKEEIIQYCKSHPNPDLSDIVFDLRLDLFDVDDMIDEIEEEGRPLNVRW